MVVIYEYILCAISGRGSTLWELHSSSVDVLIAHRAIWTNEWILFKSLVCCGKFLPTRVFCMDFVSNGVGMLRVLLTVLHMNIAFGHSIILWM